MIIFILCVIFSFSLLFLHHKGYRIRGSEFCTFILLWLIAGFRYKVGDDFLNYEYGYNHPDAIIYEPIWYLITEFLRYMGLSSQSFFLFTSFIIILFVTQGIKKMSPNYFMSICIFIVTLLYFESMNLIRQYAAMSVCLLAFYYRYNHKYFKYMLLLVLAISFHVTAIICIPIFELALIKYNRYLLSSIILLSLSFGSIISSFIISLLSNIMDSSIPYFSYLTKDEVKISSGLYQYFINFLTLFFLFFENQKYKQDKFFIAIQNLVIFSVIMYNSLLNFDVALRLNKYPFYFFILYIPMVFSSGCSKYRIIYLLGCISIFIVFTFKFVSGEAYNPFNWNFTLLQ